MFFHVDNSLLSQSVSCRRRGSFCWLVNNRKFLLPPQPHPPTPSSTRTRLKPFSPVWKVRKARGEAGVFLSATEASFLTLGGGSSRDDSRDGAGRRFFFSFSFLLGVGVFEETMSDSPAADRRVTSPDGGAARHAGAPLAAVASMATIVPVPPPKPSAPGAPSLPRPPQHIHTHTHTTHSGVAQTTPVCM